MIAVPARPGAHKARPSDATWSFPRQGRASYAPDPSGVPIMASGYTGPASQASGIEIGAFCAAPWSKFPELTAEQHRTHGVEPDLSSEILSILSSCPNLDRSQSGRRTLEPPLAHARSHGIESWIRGFGLNPTSPGQSDIRSKPLYRPRRSTQRDRSHDRPVRFDRTCSSN